MADTYTNITLRGAERPEVIEAVRWLGLAAFVAPETDNGLILVYPERHATWLAARLSRGLDCATWAVTVDGEDEALVYDLFVSGALVDRYDSAPGRADGVDLAPSGGKAAALARAFGLPEESAEDLEAVLGSTPFAKNEDGTPADFEGFDDYPYVFARDRHRDLADLLLVPDTAGIDADFSTLDRGAPPSESLSVADLHFHRPLHPAPLREMLLLDTDVDAAVVGAWIRQDDGAPESVETFPLGTHADVTSEATVALPETDGSRPGWLIAETERGALDVELGPEATPGEEHDAVTVYLFGDAALPLLRRLQAATGWRAFDPETGEEVG